MVGPWWPVRYGASRRFRKCPGALHGEVVVCLADRPIETVIGSERAVTRRSLLGVLGVGVAAGAILGTTGSAPVADSDAAKKPAKKNAAAKKPAAKKAAPKKGKDRDGQRLAEQALRQ
jgi:hypothetical protein